MHACCYFGFLLGIHPFFLSIFHRISLSLSNFHFSFTSASTSFYSCINLLLVFLLFQTLYMHSVSHYSQNLSLPMVLNVKHSNGLRCLPSTDIGEGAWRRGGIGYYAASMESVLNRWLRVFQFCPCIQSD